jgi:NADP-dependent 3-hydroxy acid dehydrogenase YdfG
LELEFLYNVRMNKRIVITGGATGIGYATYTALVKQNDQNKFVIISRYCQKKSSLFSENTLLIDADISQKEDVESATEKAIKFLGNIDILINNAGISFPGPFRESSKADIERSISVNLLGPLYVTHSFLPYFLEKKGGFIVNITSGASETGIPGLTVYSAAKFGLKGFSEALRKEITEQNIRLVEISPGGVATAIHDTLIDRKGADSVNMENALKPEDVAEAVLFSLNQPSNSSINEIQIRHSSQKMIGTYI